MKVTNKQFAFFKMCCKQYIDLFALGNWEVGYKLETLEGNRAECRWKLNGYVATIFLNDTWTGSVGRLSNKQLRSCALHEVTHLLLARLLSNAGARFIQESDLLESTEEVVMRVTRAFLGGDVLVESLEADDDD